MNEDDVESMIEEPSEVSLTEFEVQFVKAYGGRLIRRSKGCDFRDEDSKELIEVKSRVLRPSQAHEIGEAFFEHERRSFLACVEDEGVFLFKLEDVLPYSPLALEDLKLSYESNIDRVYERRNLILDDLKDLKVSKDYVRDEIKTLQDKRDGIIRHLTFLERMERDMAHLDYREKMPPPFIDRAGPKD
jgi:hypothetical protein